ncbi:MAG: phosphate regulon sensor histidine kinase PhoR [Gammaproteobacteria bacterium]
MLSTLWSTTVIRLSFIFAGAGLLGLFYGQVTLWLLLAALGCLAWHLFNLYRTALWLDRPKKAERPDAPGVWGELNSYIYHLQRSDRKRRKQVRRVLKEFRKSTAALPDGAVVLNPQHEITWFNKAASRLLGLRKKTDRRHRIDNLLRQPEFVAYLEGNDQDNPLQMASPVNDGQQLSLQLVRYGDDQQLLLVKDITREVNLERTRRDFVANASHELRTPLTVITGYLDALEDAPEEEIPATWSQPVREMRAQAGRMNAIVGDLLELSRLESAEGYASMEPVDVKGLLALIRKEALALEERPQEINLDLNGNGRLLGSESEIQSAVSNLVANAVKFTPQDGRVDISWHIDDDGGHVTIEDTGPGIPEESIPRLTERFYRVDTGRARTDAGGGTGLGLAIVKHALQRHQGWLEIDSELDKGSIFTCHFPPERVQTQTD